jgi:tRNA threonylcarbamoyl adenosine modification protein YeaZ
VILAIDTSLGSAVAVVDHDGLIRGEASSLNALGHAEIIGTLIEDALGQASVGPREITHVAAGMGPGPFTGLRIGIAAARAFALARAVPVVAVVSHDAAALAEFEADASGPIAIVTDARRREFAYTVYAGLALGLPVRESEPALAPRDDLGARLRRLAPTASPVRRVDVTAISAGALGRIAGRMIAAGTADEGATAAPLYLRSPDVTVGHTPKRVGV